MTRRSKGCPSTTSHKRRIVTPCGKMFFGAKARVNLQVKLHKKKCDMCSVENGVHYTSALFEQYTGERQRLDNAATLLGEINGV